MPRKRGSNRCETRSYGRGITNRSRRQPFPRPCTGATTVQFRDSNSTPVVTGPRALQTFTNQSLRGERGSDPSVASPVGSNPSPSRPTSLGLAYFREFAGSFQRRATEARRARRATEYRTALKGLPQRDLARKPPSGIVAVLSGPPCTPRLRGTQRFKAPCTPRLRGTQCFQAPSELPDPVPLLQRDVRLIPGRDALPLLLAQCPHHARGDAHHERVRRDPLPFPDHRARRDQ